MSIMVSFSKFKYFGKVWTCFPMRDNNTSEVFSACLLWMGEHFIYHFTAAVKETSLTD